MKYLFFIFATSFLFISCKESAYHPTGNTYYFTEPQPVNDSEIKSIPNKYLGLYINSDSIYLNVSKRMITKESYFKFRIHQNSLDSLGDELVKLNGKFRFKDKTTFLEDKKIGDSIEFSQNQIDTFFIFSDKQKAKRINGKLVLSEKDSLYWETKMVYLNNNELTVKYLYSDEDLKKMDSITKIKSQKIDSTTYLISPSRSEFKKFFEVENFGYDSKYKKVKK